MNSDWSILSLKLCSYCNTYQVKVYDFQLKFMADGIPEFLELIFATLMNCEPEKWLNSYALCVKITK